MLIRNEPAGVHIFDRSTGLHFLLDEIRPSKEVLSKFPRFISIALTNACELHCAYCFAPKHGARLSESLVIGWAAEAEANGCFGFGFGGGEPTLHPRFAHLCAKIARETQLSVSFTTHGHWSTPNLAQSLQGHVQFIRLSMDGMFSTYETNRGRPFNKFITALCTVRDTAPFGINYLVNDATIKDLPGAADFAMENGAKELLLLPEIPLHGRKEPSRETINSLKLWISLNWKDYPLRLSSLFSEPLDAPVASIADGRDSMDFLHIDASGFLKPCAFNSEGIRIANYPSLLSAVEALETTLLPSHPIAENV